jgi:hypothetical protein
VAGEKLSAARDQLLAASFGVEVRKRISTESAGTVLAQHPAAGISVRPTRTVTLIVAKPAATPSPENCPSTPLLGVYHSYRLHILGTCRWYSGTVIAVIHEADGDYHLRVKPASGYSSFLDHDNYSQQYGTLVGEIMPGQHLPLPSVGEEISMFGTWVYDADHGWNEIHPIWAIRYSSGRTIYSLPPATPEYGSGSGSSSGSGGSGDCTPGYSPCLVSHGGADYDCYGGGGNGPYYTQPGVVYRVTGSDPYGLDADHNGYGC